MLYPRLNSPDNISTTKNLLEWKVGLTILHVIAIASTTFRIWYRRHICRLWWDDYMAVFPAILEIVYLVSALWLRFESSQVSNDFIRKQMVLYWVSSILFVFIMWTSRICLALSIARIFAPGQAPRRFALTLVVIFGIACVGMTISKTVTSIINDRNGVRHFHERAHCGRGAPLCIVGFILSVSADFVLIVAPLFMLWHVKLPRNQRYLIFAVFSASFLTLLSATVYILCVFTPINKTRAGPVLLVMVPQLESAVAVFVCNISVVVSFMYRTFRHYGDMDTVATRETSSRTVPMVTTTSPGELNSSVLILTTIISETNSTSAVTSVFPSSDDSFEPSQGSKVVAYD